MPRSLAAARTLSAARGYAAQVLLDAPVGYWRLNEGSSNFQDMSGNALTLTPGASGVGYRNAGLLLPFAGDAAQCPSNAAIALATIADNATLSITGNLTLELWMQRPDTATGTFVLLSKGSLSAPTNLSYSLFIDGNNGLTLRLSVDGSTVIGTASAVNALLNTNIHHIAATYQQTGTVVCLYIDGVLVKRATNGPASIFDSPASFRIGCGASNADAPAAGFANGLMQDVAVYNSVLSAGRIAEHYQIGRMPARSLSAARSLV